MVLLVVLVGRDFRRVIDGIRFWHQRIPIDRIYLLYDRKKDAFGYMSRRNAEDLTRALSFAFERPARVAVNMSSYTDVFSAVYCVLRRELPRRKGALIDVTSAPVEAACAAVMAAMMFPGVRVYSVPAASEPRPEPGSAELEEWFEKVRMIPGGTPVEIHLPGERLRPLDANEERLLLLLLEHGGKAPSIRRLIEWCGFDPKDPAVKNRFSRLVARLRERGLVTVKPGSRAKPVALTGFGVALASAIRRYAIEERAALPEVELAGAPGFGLDLEEEHLAPA